MNIRIERKTKTNVRAVRLWQEKIYTEGKITFRRFSNHKRARFYKCARQLWDKQLWRPYKNHCEIWFRECHQLWGFEVYSVSIGDVANSKRHQWLNDILIFTWNILGISKAACKKTLSGTRTFFWTSVCCMKRAHYSKRMLCKQDFVGVLHNWFF